MPPGRLVELGEDLLTAVAAPRVHDQVVPNATYIEHWRAGDASFMVPQQEVEVRGVLPACSTPVLPKQDLWGCRARSSRMRMARRVLRVRRGCMQYALVSGI